eukprot:1858428-Pleurochrysis_carterae.AAC.3
MRLRFHHRQCAAAARRQLALCRPLSPCRLPPPSPMLRAFSTLKDIELSETAPVKTRTAAAFACHHHQGCFRKSSSRNAESLGCRMFQLSWKRACFNGDATKLRPTYSSSAGLLFRQWRDERPRSGRASRAGLFGVHA